MIFLIRQLIIYWNPVRCCPLYKPVFLLFWNYTSVTGKTEMNFSVHCRFIWKMNGQSPVPPKLSIRTETPCSTVSERFRICLITTCPIPIHGNTRYCPSRLCICITVKQTIIIVKHEKSGMNNDLKYVIIITQILTV